jgi:hypothetical protein
MRAGESTGETMMNNDTHLQAVIADELASNAQDMSLWEKALAYRKGDAEQAKALYARMRLLDLQEAASPPRPPAARPAAATPPSDELHEIRQQLASGLATANKSSLYNALALSPTCDDTEVAKRIALIAGQAKLSGAPVGAERKYAMDIIGNPAARARYDKTLLSDISVSIGQTDRGPSASGGYSEPWSTSGSTFSDWWASRKVTAIITAGIFIAVGYLYTNHRTTSNSREAITTVKEIEVRRLDNEKYAIEQRTRFADESTELKIRAMALQEEREKTTQAQLERQAYLQAQRMEMERQREEGRARSQQEAMESRARMDEQRRIERERKYWACMNNALNQYRYDKANSNCAMYK